MICLNYHYGKVMACYQSQGLGLFHCVVGPKGSPCTEAAQDGTSAVLIAGATVGSLLFIVILIPIVVVLVRRECKYQRYIQDPRNSTNTLRVFNVETTWKQ